MQPLEIDTRWPSLLVRFIACSSRVYSARGAGALPHFGPSGCGAPVHRPFVPSRVLPEPPGPPFPTQFFPTRPLIVALFCHLISPRDATVCIHIPYRVSRPSFQTPKHNARSSFFFPTTWSFLTNVLRLFSILWFVNQRRAFVQPFCLVSLRNTPILNIRPNAVPSLALALIGLVSSSGTGGPSRYRHPQQRASPFHKATNSPARLDLSQPPRHSSIPKTIRRRPTNQQHSPAAP